jgi:glycosyltransferase involved in cell wall biosynthesis
MKVLMLQDTKNYAGTEAHILTLSTALSKLGSINVEFLVPKGSELEQRGQANGLRCHVCNQNALTFFCSTILVAMKTRPDILHAHNGRTALVSVLVSKILRCKVVATQHFLEPAHLNSTGNLGKVKRSLHQWVGRQVDFRICVSRATLNCMLDRGDIVAKSENRVKVIYSGIPTKNLDSDMRTSCRRSILAELDLSDDVLLVLTAARLEREKSVDLFIKAVSPLCLRNRNIHVLIAGDGAQKNQLKSLVTSDELRSQVHFLGHRNDVEVLMAASDMFVLSSSIESFGMVLLEAMSKRIPVVAPNAGGPKEIIEDTKSGLLYDPGDVTDLVAKIEFLLCDVNKRWQLGSAGYNRLIDVFTVQKMASDTVSAYTQALTGSNIE